MISTAQGHIDLFSRMDAYRKQLKERITQEEVQEIYEFCETVKDNEEVGRYMFDANNTLHFVAQKLYRALFFSTSEYCGEFMTSNGARWIKDADTQETLFVYKCGQLSQWDLGVKGFGTEREQLFYLLDRGNFSGVPPLFSVYTKSFNNSSSYSLFIENCSSLQMTRSIEESTDSLRRCFIHQFRTNMVDPWFSNILMSNRDPRKIYPIDGGYTLPHKVSQLMKFCIKGKFLEGPFNQEEIRYIERLNIEDDCRLISDYLPNMKPARLEKTLNLFRAVNLILKKAVECSVSADLAGKSITLRDIKKMRTQVVESSDKPPRKVCSLIQYVANGGDRDGMNDRIVKIFKETEVLKTQQAYKYKITNFSIKFLKDFERTGVV